MNCRGAVEGFKGAVDGSRGAVHVSRALDISCKVDVSRALDELQRHLEELSTVSKCFVSKRHVNFGIYSRK